MAYNEIRSALSYPSSRVKSVSRMTFWLQKLLSEIFFFLLQPILKFVNNILHYFFCLSSEVFCPIVGCGAHLRSLAEFEDHYNARHTASCSVCSRVYPTSRLLSIHVSEAHDSFFQAKVARGYAMVILHHILHFKINAFSPVLPNILSYEWADSGYFYVLKKKWDKSCPNCIFKHKTFCTILFKRLDYG